MKKLRAYEYRCRRCGKVFDENVGFNSELVSEHILLICIPDEEEEIRLKETYSKYQGDLYLGDLQLKSRHDCKDGGYGIGELIGCSKEYII